MKVWAIFCVPHTVFCSISEYDFCVICPIGIINNYWTRLSMKSRIIRTEVNVICRSRSLRRITLTVVWIILDIMGKPNPIIVLLYIQKREICKKRFAVKRLVRLTFQTAAGNFFLFCNFRGLEVVTSSASNNFFLDSSVEQFTTFCWNDVTASGHWELTGECRSIRNKNEVCECIMMVVTRSMTARGTSPFIKPGHHIVTTWWDWNFDLFSSDEFASVRLH